MSDRDTRFVNKRISINKDSLKSFFDDRGDKYVEDQPYVTTLYQDQNKTLAAERDKHEKTYIKPLLKFNGNNRVLDVGCGVGRWADAIIDDLSEYVGIDVSNNMIEIAKKRYLGKSKASFITLDAKDISDDTIASDGRLFDRVIISGVLLYLNDDELTQTLAGILKNCAKNCIIYIREPLALIHRLSLDRHWSQELNAEYSAIYRTIEEITDAIKVFISNGFEMQSFHALYSDLAMLNRKETNQFFTILSRT